MSHHTRSGSSYGSAGETPTPIQPTTAAAATAGSIGSRVGGPNGRNRSPSQEALHAIVSDADLAEMLN